MKAGDLVVYVTPVRAMGTPTLDEAFASLELDDEVWLVVSLHNVIGATLFSIHAQESKTIRILQLLRCFVPWSAP